jgi:hypothetical protein
MTQSEKISILIKKYGHKSIMMDLTGQESYTNLGFNPPFILPDQLYVDLQNLPYGKNPLINSPVNLSEWTNANSPVIRKIVKKTLTWIRGTYAFYDPSDPSNDDAVVDIISPSHHISFSPEVFILNAKSNVYIDRISPSEYPWSFDYETGCLVFLDGFPKQMKSPQFQPPAITAYRYVGKKSAYGLSPDTITGPSGPTGPKGDTGNFETESMNWSGSYNALTAYAVDDIVEQNGILYVKKTGSTGPTSLTPTYFDSITYNELQDGFIKTYCEQYFDSSFSIGTVPYFQELQDFYEGITTSTYPGDFFYKYKNCDQTLHVFDAPTNMFYYVDIAQPYSTRINFYSPLRMEDDSYYGLMSGGNRIFSIDGLYTNDSVIDSRCSLEINNSKIIEPVSSSMTLNFYADPYGISFDGKDVSFKSDKSYYQDANINLYGKSQIDSSSFWNSTIRVGDQSMNSGALSTLQYRDRVVHMFTDCELIDTNIILDYSGRYSNVELIFVRCSFIETRQSYAYAGITFPVRPYEFSDSNSNRYRVKISIINSTLTCPNSSFNVPDYSDITTYGSCVMPSTYAPSIDSMFTRIGTTTINQALADFLESQTEFSSSDARQNSCFYFNL